MKKFITIIATLLVTAFVAVASEDLRNPSEDFIRASVMVASPGDALYSRTGHAFIRMQCPSQNMDFCFSYESEDVNAKVVTFLAGRLRMGLVGMRTPQYLAEYEKEGRGVAEYPLNLPVKVKQNLWRVLDRHVDEGMDLPYDYLDRGCAISVMHLLEEATIPQGLALSVIPEEFDKSRREILSDELSSSPWSRLMINVLTNGSANDEVDLLEKAITPMSLISILSKATYGGVRILGGEREVIKAEDQRQPWKGVTPMMLAVCLVAFSCYFAIRGGRWILFGMLAITSLLGLLNFYLVFVSHLCATEWSWLIVPFNPLPLMFWKFRRRWLVSFGAICIVWAIVIMVVPGSLTDSSLAVTAVASGIVYIAEGMRMNKEIQERVISTINKIKSQLNINQLKECK